MRERRSGWRRVRESAENDVWPSPGVGGIGGFAVIVGTTRPRAGPILDWRRARGQRFARVVRDIVKR